MFNTSIVSFFAGAAALALLSLAPVACDSDSGPQSYGDESKPGTEEQTSPADSNMPAQNANLAVGIVVADKVVLDIDWTAAPANADLQTAATVGQALVVNITFLGATNPWSLQAPAFSSEATAISSQQVADQTVSTSRTTYATAGLAPGTYDVVATFQGQVAGVTTSATITVHVTLAAAGS